MKKYFYVFIVLLLIAFILAIKLVSDHKVNERKKFENNKELEKYNTTVEISGLISAINIAVNKNDENLVEEDENGYYIQNEKNSVEIEVKFLQSDQTFKMEKLYKNDLKKLAELYVGQKFKCMQVKYHKSTGYIKYLYFEELE